MFKTPPIRVLLGPNQVLFRRVWIPVATSDNKFQNTIVHSLLVKFCGRIIWYFLEFGLFLTKSILFWELENLVFSPQSFEMVRNQIMNRFCLLCNFVFIFFFVSLNLRGEHVFEVFHWISTTTTVVVWTMRKIETVLRKKFWLWKTSRLEASPFNSVSGQVLPQNWSLDLLNKLLCNLFQQLRSCWYVYWLRGIRVRLKRVSVKSAWEASFRSCYLTRHSVTIAVFVSGVCSVRTRAGVMATFQVDPSWWIRLWHTWKLATVVPTFRKVSSRFWPDE